MRSVDILNFVSEMRLALYQCGQVAQALQGQVAREDKAPDSVHQVSTAVSVVDRLCQEILLLHAARLVPGLEIQSEELADCPAAIAALFAHNHHRYVLVLDPVDGSGDYLDGKETYAHMLGLLDQETGHMDCGMVYFPVRQRLYVGARGLGAFVADGFWGPLRPLPVVPPPRTVEDVKRLLPSDFDAFAALGFTVVPPASGSAAFELTRITQGNLGAMVMRQFHGHDSAINSVLIEALGGAVLTAPGQPATYDKSMARMPLVVLSLSAQYASELVARL